MGEQLKNLKCIKQRIISGFFRTINNEFHGFRLSLKSSAFMTDFNRIMKKASVSHGTCPPDSPPHLHSSGGGIDDPADSLCADVLQ